MSQRIYQAMKFLALLVFSFEMLAPAFVSGASPNKRETATRIINATSTTQNQLYCLIAEEFGASEEDGEGHKEFISFFDFENVTILNLNLIESAATSLVCVPHFLEHAAQRPLFLLHRLLLI